MINESSPAPKGGPLADSLQGQMQIEPKTTKGK